MSQRPGRMTPALRAEQVLDALARLVIVVDTDLRIVAWNGVAETLFGRTRAEMLGADLIGAVIPEPDRSQARRNLAEVLRGAEWRGKHRVIGRDDRPVFLSTFLSPLRDETGGIVGVVGAADDVTALNALERRAASLADHLHLALAAGRLGIWEWEMASGVTRWDANTEALFGLAPGEFDGTFDAWVALLHPEDVDHVLARLDEAVTDRSHFGFDHRVLWPDGTVRWLEGRGRIVVDEAGEVTGAIGCTADITARKDAEMAAERQAREAASLADQMRLQHERLAFLSLISDAALASADHWELMAQVARAAVPQLGDWCSLHYRANAGQRPEVVVAHVDPDKTSWADELLQRFPYVETATAGVPAVIRSGRPEFVATIDAEWVATILESIPMDRDELAAVIDSLDLTSVITVPLATKRGVLGAMQFVSAESGRRYDDDDLALAQAAAGRVAEALENMVLAEEQRHIAATLQAALLPSELPSTPGIDLAVRYWAAGGSEVGGDFYDVFALDGHRWAVVIGDVCGTGAEAAAVTGIARHTIRAAARHGQGHTDVLAWVNDAVRAEGQGRFCTTCYATVEQAGEGMVFTCSSGGHPLPVVVRADGTVETPGRPGTLLGVFERINTSVATVQLAPGDTVVLHTDGITDLPPPHDVDDAALHRLVADAAGGETAQEVAGRLHAALSAMRPMDERHDDIALIVLRIAPDRQT